MNKTRIWFFYMHRLNFQMKIQKLVYKYFGLIVVQIIFPSSFYWDHPNCVKISDFFIIIIFFKIFYKEMVHYLV